MTTNSTNLRRVRFGAFEVDLQARELRKRGLRIKLQEQPFQVLMLLLERPGQVVPREELHRRLWPDDTFVGFDQAINTAINKIREALNDSATNPRFVETLPRRGYRFIAPVEPIAERTYKDAYGCEGQRKEASVRGRKAWRAFAAVLAIGLGATYLWGPMRRGQDKPEAPLRIVPLTSYPGIERSPSFSPDGSQVVFSWNGQNQDNFDIYVKLIDGETPLRLTTHPARDIFPSWSPDGREIAFLRWSADCQRYAVHLVSPLGGAERHLTELAEAGSSPAWSPDGKLLALKDRGSSSGPFSIYLFSVETGEKRKLTSPPAGYRGDWGPAFSPDGQILAFVRIENLASSDIYVYPLSGDEARRLSFDDQEIRGLAWTPDGSEIIFSSNRASQFSLWRLPSSGGTPKHVGVAPALQLTISRQGNHLIYEKADEFYIENANIWRFELPAGPVSQDPPEKLIQSTRNDDNPQYSPDGSQIAFASDRSGNWEIWVCDSEGRNLRKLTSFGSGASSWPSWSPDGKQIAFNSDAKGNWDIYVINVLGGLPKQLTTDLAGDARPFWSPNSPWVYFASKRSGTMQVWKVLAQGGIPVQVTRQGGYNPVVSPDGKFVYYAKGRGIGRDSGSIWRVPAEGGEEELILGDGPPSFSGHFLAADGGLYFLQGGYLNFFGFDNGEVRQVTPQVIPVHPSSAAALALSPDRRWLLSSVRDERGSDLMLAENFR